MTFRPTTLERAYALAAAGECRTTSDIKRVLKFEGYIAIDDQLYGNSIARDLRSLCKANYREPVVAEA